MKITKKQKLDNYDALADRAALYERYFWDREAGKAPDVTVRWDGCSIKVYSTMAAHGGYCVYRTENGVLPSLYWWEKWENEVKRYTLTCDLILSLRSAVERAGILVRKFQRQSEGKEDHVQTVSDSRPNVRAV